MKIIDTHSHIYLEEFDADLPEVIERARLAGVDRILFPNVDSTTLERMLSVCRAYEGYCYPMIGVHPTSVKDNCEAELAVVKQQLASSDAYIAVGEVGLDLYWDKTFLKEQIYVFDKQIQWALEYNLPLVIHSREAFEEVCKVLRPYKDTSLRGVFHSFTGTIEDAARLLEFERFLLGINGVVTFKKSILPEVLTFVPLERIVLETDAPYLTPMPYRGKRNESAHLLYTLMKIGEIYEKAPEFIAEQTSTNALKLFGLSENCD